MKIAVLLGGTSAERDVSFSSGVAIARALRENGHDVQAIDCAYGDKTLDFETVDPSQLVKTTPPDIENQKATLDRNLFKTVDYLAREQFDAAFIGLHGGYGENGQIQALLEIAGIPYTGSGSLASAMGIDKHISKIIFQANFVPTAPWQHHLRNENIERHRVKSLGLPLVVKPNSQGSTVGLSIIQSLDELDSALEIAFKYSHGVLLEQYIPGRELTVAVLGNEALPVLEIIPKSGFYDYEAKYQGGLTRYEVPAKLPEKLSQKIREAALRAFQSLQCQGYARVDFRLRDDDKFFCLELNTLPGMTATSLAPKMAKAVGINFNELIERIVQLALLRDS